LSIPTRYNKLSREIPGSWQRTENAKAQWTTPAGSPHTARRQKGKEEVDKAQAVATSASKLNYSRK